MEDTLKALISEAEEGIPAVRTRPEFEAFKARYVGPHGSLTRAMRGIKQIPREDKPRIGKLLNRAKKRLEEVFEVCLGAIEDGEQAAKWGEAIDPSLPSPDPPPGNLHPLTQVREEINRILKSVGFAVADGPEVDTEYFCFDALNTPDDHPARDEQDTFYLPAEAKFANVKKFSEERYLLRTHNLHGADSNHAPTETPGKDHITGPMLSPRYGPMPPTAPASPRWRDSTWIRVSR